MRHLFLRFPNWSYIVMPVLISLIASGLIAQLQRRDDDFRNTQVDLTRIEAAIYQRHAIEEEVTANKRLPAEMAQAGEQANNQADMQILELRREHPHSALLDRVHALYLAYDAGIERQFGLLTKGQFEQAEHIAQEQVDPYYLQLMPAIKSASAFYQHQATLEIRRTTLGTTVLLVCGALFLGIFMRRFAQTQRTEALLDAHRIEEERTRAVLETALVAVIGMDAQGAIIGWNAQAEAIFGWKREEILGRVLAEIIVPEALRESHRRGIARYLATNEARLIGQRFETEALHRKGHLFPVEMSLSCVRAGSQVTFSAFISDISERKAAEARLEHQALHDGLTGLPNRLLFQDRVDGAITRMGVQGSGVAVLFVDLDNFKFINDSMGHEAGDELLKAVAQRLEACARRGDTVARLSGDEFTLLVDNIHDVNDAVQTAERIIAQLQQPLSIAGRELFVSASVGIAFSNDEELDAGHLLRDADAAMYQAKSHGKSGYVLYDASMNADIEDRMEIETGLRFAVARNELRVYYQPLINLETGCMTGVEALVRWEHSTLGLLAPGKFIPIAEETGLIVPIGYWVLEEACRQVQEWKSAYPEYGTFTVNVNLSGKQLQRPDVVERVAACLEKTRIAPGNVKIEITETVMLEDAADSVAKLTALKALGVKLALDDFGTGYSSMASLNLFPLDTVKIDRAFVKRLTEHHESGSIVAAIIMLSKALHLDVTGEGVETEEQLVQLQSLGCNIGQGYYFAKPLSACELADQLAEGPRSLCAINQKSDEEAIEQYLLAA